jgi:predicted nucleotidyltransferase
MISLDTERGAKRFIELARERYDICGTLLFGSRARGDGGPDSDVDLAVVIRGPKGDRVDTAADMAGLAFDVMLETGVLVDPLPLWDEEWSHPEHFSNPRLLANIRRDGVAL